MTSSLPRLALAAVLSALAAPGCATSSEVLALRCDVDVADIQPQPSKVGESVTVTGTPFTSVYDSAVYVDGVRATVTEVERAGCTECDQCRFDYGCTECTDCDACDRLCETGCVETVTFDVPPVEPGSHGLQLFNAHGQTRVLELTVQSTGFESDPDTGPTDTGTSDDSGVADVPASAPTGG